MDLSFKGLVSRVLPGYSQDNLPQIPRLSRYGELMVVESLRTKHPLSDEGSYFTTQNPTIGTALAFGVSAAFSDTAAALVFYNPADANEPSSPRLHLDFIKFMPTVAPASATGWRYLVKLDNASRVPSANSALLVGTGGAANPGPNPPGPFVRDAIAKIWAFSGGTLTVPASSGNARVVAAGGGGGLPVVPSEYSIRFGSDAAPASGVNGGVSVAAPLSIPPGYYAVAYLWFPSNATTALSAEIDLGWWER